MNFSCDNRSMFGCGTHGCRFRLDIGTLKGDASFGLDVLIHPVRRFAHCLDEERWVGRLAHRRAQTEGGY